MTTKHKKAAEAAKLFGLKPVKTIRVKKGVYRIVGSRRQSYSMKRMPVPLTTIRWMDRSLRKILRSGFKRIAWRKTASKYGRILFVRMKSDKRPYVLVPWIRGRWPSPQSPKDMRACGVLLAQFHKAGRGVRFSEPGAVNKLGKWPSELRMRHWVLSDLVSKASMKKEDRRPMDRLLSEHGQELLRYSRVARRQLNRLGYKRICRKRKLAALCHGDGGPSNFIRNAKGLYLIDFETLRVDLRAYDLYRVIFNSCKEHDWRFSIARRILDGYHSVLRLEAEDFAMLRTLLRFPQSSYLLLRRYRRSGNRDQKWAEKEFLRALADERRMAGFIRKLKRYERRLCGN
ncbi:serine kinase [Cohnella pontilimi]|uniref:Serine kinase n=1 Tax=Cohnella pontilimi TaxID=2564100 RepID=A0A4U0FG88_9BACL|nr:phosphotransferase [Cohnella pontilimi]TJY43937.1 serine kinase [Cohnella pontilimi]